MTLSGGKPPLTSKALDYLDSILAGAVAEARVVLVDHDHMGEDGDGGCNLSLIHI